MSGASVCVLALNGRRQTVKCTPNTTILQILEEVCKKQGLQPEEYDLKHHNKVLDTTTIFRFSGLPNNAQLELAPVLKLRSEGDITLAINLENGNRLMGNFKPNDTLLNILNKLCPESIAQDKNPVVIYTRREIYGKELENVTLRSLGLTGGRAMIRLIHRLPEELKIQANISAPLPSKPVEEKPYIRKLERIPSPPRNTEQSLNSPDNNNADVGKCINNEDAPKSPKSQRSYSILKLPREKKRSNDASSNEEKRRSSDASSSEERRKCNDVTSNKEMKKSNERQLNTNDAKMEREACECRMDEPMEVDCCGKCERKCTNVVEKNLEKNVEEEFVFLGERNAMLFSLETARAVPSEDLPDDFFELTIDDARKILRDVKRQRLGMDNTPLMTSALRKLETSKKQLWQLNKYKKAIIRVQFPDRTVLQGTFSPVDTIRDVIRFVREYLEDKSLNFYVYSTPPKCILEEDKRLIELGFVPGAMIHFGVHSGKRNNFLRRDLQQKFTSSSVASLAASRVRSENTRLCTGPQQSDDDDIDMEQSPSIITNAGASTSTGITHENYERKIVKSTEKVPKWFKP